MQNRNLSMDPDRWLRATCSHLERLFDQAADHGECEDIAEALQELERIAGERGDVIDEVRHAVA